MPYYTHSDTDFGLEVDQFPSESLCERCDGVFGGRVHVYTYVNRWRMPKDAVRCEAKKKYVVEQVASIKLLPAIFKYPHPTACFS
jgi:hypothetical protein